MYYARYCPYGVTAISQEDRIISYRTRSKRDKAVGDDPYHLEPLSSNSLAVRRHLQRLLDTGEPLHNPHEF